MPESRGRPPNRRPQRQSHKQSWRKRIGGILQTFADHPIWALFGVISSLAAVGEPIRQAFVQPDIVFETANVDLSAPLSAPFLVKNGSWLFNMGDAQPICSFDQLISGNLQYNNLGKSGRIKLMGRIETIPRKDERLFRCRFGQDADDILRGSSTSLEAAHMYLSVEYRILWFIGRSSDPIEFTWYTRTKPPRWIRGKIVG